MESQTTSPNMKVIEVLENSTQSSSSLEQKSTISLFLNLNCEAFLRVLFHLPLWGLVVIQLDSPFYLFSLWPTLRKWHSLQLFRETIKVTLNGLTVKPSQLTKHSKNLQQLFLPLSCFFFDCYLLFSLNILQGSWISPLFTNYLSVYSPLPPQLNKFLLPILLDWRRTIFLHKTWIYKCTQKDRVQSSLIWRNEWSNKPRLPRLIIKHILKGKMKFNNIWTEFLSTQVGYVVGAEHDKA